MYYIGCGLLIFELRRFHIESARPIGPAPAMSAYVLYCVTHERAWFATCLCQHDRVCYADFMAREEPRVA